MIGEHALARYVANAPPEKGNVRGRKMMKEDIHRYSDPSYAIDAAQWGYNRRKRRDRVVGMCCVAMAATAFVRSNE